MSVKGSAARLNRVPPGVEFRAKRDRESRMRRPPFCGGRCLFWSLTSLPVCGGADRIGRSPRLGADLLEATGFQHVATVLSTVDVSITRLKIRLENTRSESYIRFVTQ